MNEVWAQGPKGRDREGLTGSFREVGCSGTTLGAEGLSSSCCQRPRPPSCAQPAKPLDGSGHPPVWAPATAAGLPHWCLPEGPGLCQACEEEGAGLVAWH